MDALAAGRRAGAYGASDAADEAAAPLPQRPYLPPLLVVGLCFWAACCIALKLLVVQGQAALVVVATAGAGSVVAGIAAVRSRKTVVLMALGAALGALVAGAFACSVLHAESALESASYSGPGRFLVVEDPVQGEFGKSCFARTALADGTVVHVRLNLPDSADVSCWDTIEASAGIAPAKDKNRSYLWQHGACGQATVRSFRALETGGPLGALARVRNAASALYDGDPSDGAALMQALLLGKRERLFQSAVYDSIKRCGIAHMVAVSGAHLVVITGFVAQALRALRLPKRPVVAVLTAFIVVYVVLAGAPVSAIRAGAMAVCSLGSFFARRRAAPLSALGLVMLCLVAASPSCALSLSFALSALATLGIILFARYFQQWALAMLGGRLRGLADVLGLTAAANLYTLPLSVATFGQLSLVAPLANAVCGPLFSALCVGGALGTVAAGACAPIRATALGAVCGAGNAFCELVELLAQVPCAAVAATGSAPVLLGAAAAASIALLAAWPRPRARTGWSVAAAGAACLLAALVVLPLFHGNELIMLDVGQGDSFVVRSGGTAVMIDTGTNDTEVLQGLARHDVRRLDAVVITHHDDDHCGSLAAVRGYVQVDRICVARDLLSCTCENCAKLRSQIADADVVALDAGDRLAFGALTLRVLGPERFEDEGGNADSVVMRLSCDADGDGVEDASALFTGDAEAPALDKLAQAGELSPIDILKVPHHGSKAGLDDKLMERLQPKLALISVGAGNRYGHPKQETLDRLEGFGCAVERTDEAGDVVCSLDGAGVQVRRSR